MNKEERKFKEKLPSDKLKSLGFSLARILIIPPVYFLTMNVLHFYGQVEYRLHDWWIFAIVYVIAEVIEFYRKLMVLQEELQIKEGKEL
jgi:hypothetical protein